MSTVQAPETCLAMLSKTGSATNLRALATKSQALVRVLVKVLTTGLSIRPVTKPVSFSMMPVKAAQALPSPFSRSLAKVAASPSQPDTPSTSSPRLKPPRAAGRWASRAALILRVAKLSGPSSMMSAICGATLRSSFISWSPANSPAARVPEATALPASSRRAAPQLSAWSRASSSLRWIGAPGPLRSRTAGPASPGASVLPAAAQSSPALPGVLPPSAASPPPPSCTSTAGPLAWAASSAGRCSAGPGGWRAITASLLCCRTWVTSWAIRPRSSGRSRALNQMC